MQGHDHRQVPFIVEQLSVAAHGTDLNEPGPLQGPDHLMSRDGRELGHAGLKADDRTGVSMPRAPDGRPSVVHSPGQSWSWARTLAASPSALTLGQARSTLPCSSTRKVERRTPTEVRP